MTIKSYRRWLDLDPGYYCERAF